MRQCRLRIAQRLLVKAQHRRRPRAQEIVLYQGAIVQEQYDHAEGMLAAYEAAADRGGSGAAIYDGEMIDEANRKMAERLAGAGRAAGLTPTPATAAV